MVDLDLEWGAMTSWSRVVHETMLTASLLFFFVALPIYKVTEFSFPNRFSAMDNYSYCQNQKYSICAIEWQGYPSNSCRNKQ